MAVCHFLSTCCFSSALSSRLRCTKISPQYIWSSLGLGHTFPMGQTTSATSRVFGPG